jgi:predicted TIM-barrel fold metal-dependent hydrolase
MKERCLCRFISHGPRGAAPSVCTAANDNLAAAISKNPIRLAGFAVITMSQPAAAARELTRCVKDLGFIGALVENHVDGQFDDDELTSDSGPSLKLHRSWMFQSIFTPCFPAKNIVMSLVI